MLKVTLDLLFVYQLTFNINFLNEIFSNEMTLVMAVSDTRGVRLVW